MTSSKFGRFDEVPETLKQQLQFFIKHNLSKTNEKRENLCD